VSFPFFRPSDAGGLDDLVGELRCGVHLGRGLFLGMRHVSCLLHALYCGRPVQSQVDVPASEAREYDAEDARYDCEKDIIDGRKGQVVLSLGFFLKHFPHDPGERNCKAEIAKQAGVDQEEEKWFVVAMSNTCGQPRTVMIHLQDTAATC